MRKAKLPSSVQPHSKVKPMQTQRTTPPENPFWKKFPKPIINAAIVGSVTALVIPLSALGVLAVSKCGALRVKFNLFELQLIKGSCSTPPDQKMK